MRNDEFNKPRGHIFDGIQEYDNDLPRWWVLLFVLTIIFAVGYFSWFELPFFASKSLVDVYAEESLADQRAASEGQKASAGGSVPAFSYAAAFKDEAMLAAGKETFTQMCVSCHGALGEGLIGPNLTDEFWLHGHTAAEIEEVVINGVPDKGMPTWKDVLGPEKIHQLVVFIKSIQGTAPANPKAPQGTPGGLSVE